jgi:hypothetical protein
VISRLTASALRAYLVQTSDRSLHAAHANPKKKDTDHQSRLRFELAAGHIPRSAKRLQTAAFGHHIVKWRGSSVMALWCSRDPTSPEFLHVKRLQRQPFSCPTLHAYKEHQSSGAHVGGRAPEPGLHQSDIDTDTVRSVRSPKSHVDKGAKVTSL